jgi:hypothetical protein
LVNGSIACSNSEFQDPAPTEAKTCVCSSNSDNDTPTKRRTLQIMNTNQVIKKKESFSFNFKNVITNSPTISTRVPTNKPTQQQTQQQVPDVYIDYCTDRIQNNMETDIDCGGPSCIQRCISGQSCLRSVDCSYELFCNSTDGICAVLPPNVPIQITSTSISVISVASVAIQSIQTSSVGSSFDGAFMGAVALAMNLEYSPDSFRTYTSNFFWTYMTLVPIPSSEQSNQDNRRMLIPDGWLQNTIPHPYLQHDTLLFSFILTSMVFILLLTLYAKLWLKLNSYSQSSRHAISTYTYTIIIPVIYFISISAQIAFTPRMGISIGIRIASGIFSFTACIYLCYFWYKEWVRYNTYYKTSVETHTENSKAVVPETVSYFLSKHFKRDYFWFWSIRLITSSIRGVTLAFLAIFPLTQSVLITCTFVVCLLFTLKYDPYDDRLLTISNIFNLCCTIAFHIVIVLFTCYESISSFDNITTIMLCLQMATTLSSAFVSGRGFYLSRRKS